MLGAQWSCFQPCYFNQVHRVHPPPRKASGAMAAVSTVVRLQTSGDDLSRPGLGDEDDIRQNVRLCMYVESMGSVSRAWSMATGKSWLPHDPMNGITRPRSRKAIPALTCPHPVYHKCRASLRPLRPIRELAARANCFLLNHYSRFSESGIQPGANR